MALRPGTRRAADAAQPADSQPYVLGAELGPCFEAVIPAILATASAAGEPNIIAVSYVHRMDDRHVAISRQFFRKTHQNLAENPWAQVVLMDPNTMDTHRLTLRRVREETSGALFDLMAARIDAVASLTGMAGVFRLQAATVFEVVAGERLEHGLHAESIAGAIEASSLSGIDTMTQLSALRRISEIVRSETNPEALLDTVLEVLDEVLGFEHTMLLLPDESGERLFTIASRGYPESGVGAEVGMGEGVIGTVARERRILRFSSMQHARLYGRAVRASVMKPKADEIMLPGLPNVESHLAIPLVVKDELLGVLAVESERQLHYTAQDEAFLDVVAGHVALGLSAALRPGQEEPSAAVADAAPVGLGGDTTRSFAYYEADDCIFVDGHFLTRNIPGRILWRLLSAYAKDGQTEFTNRELRLDATLGLPALRDNLESRLILLRKRLVERCPDLRIEPIARGRFRLAVDCQLALLSK